MTPDDKKLQADNLLPEDDRVYDLLVDGELDEDRRRTLLGSLDKRPGGWRRCALAFLEAQSWGQEFRSFSARLCGSGEETGADASTPKNVPGKKESSGAKRRRMRNRMSTILGIAASFLLAMGITSLMQDMNPSGVSGPFGSDQASVLLPKKNIPTRLFPARSQVGHLGLNNDITQEMHLMSITGRDRSGKERTFALPAVSQDKLNERWLQEMPTAIPDGVVESFQQAGHDVKTSRHLIPFTMRDGRKLIIPVDQVDVSHVATPYYQ